MKPVVINRDGYRVPFDASLISEVINRAVEELLGPKLEPMAFSVLSRETIGPFNFIGTIEDLEIVPCMKGHPPYLFSLAKLLEVSCRQVRPP
ncbi:TPA: hypothetical protein PKO72_002163 [Aeromonas hydrophila]|nr:hypothetical protein [Aeromonas hydrophila]